MLAKHFSNHKTKYIGFFIVTFMAISVTRFVTTSEARGLPLIYSETDRQNMEQIQSNCPPFLRYRIMHSPFFIHPCMRTEVNQTPSVPAIILPVSNEATSTPETATSTEEIITTSTTTAATSTEEVSEDSTTLQLL